MPQDILINWDESFLVGNELIDNQHYNLVQIINKLYFSFVEAKATEILEEIIAELVGYTKYHFSFEEQLVENLGFVLSERHKNEHKDFIIKIEEFQNRYMQDDIYLSFDIMNFLRAWLVEHILVNDKTLKDKLKNIKNIK